MRGYLSDNPRLSSRMFLLRYWMFRSYLGYDSAKVTTRRIAQTIHVSWLYDTASSRSDMINVRLPKNRPDHSKVARRLHPASRPRCAGYVYTTSTRRLGPTWSSIVNVNYQNALDASTSDIRIDTMSGNAVGTHDSSIPRPLSNNN